ncbi:MAG: hypothetical protein AB8G96_17480 [Phycisphaerales bacterium]
MRVSLVVLADPPPPAAGLDPGSRVTERDAIDLGEGRTALDHLLARMVATRAHDLVLLTDPERPLASRRRPGVRTVPGRADSVAARVLEAASRPRTSAVVVVDMASPMLDPALVDRVIDEHGCDLSAVVSTEHPRTFPAGQSVELIPMAVLRRLASGAFGQAPAALFDGPQLGPAASCTAALHATPAAVTWRPVVHDPDRSEERLALETEADVAVLRQLIADLGPGAPILGWRELMRREPAARRAAHGSHSVASADASASASASVDASADATVDTTDPVSQSPTEPTIDRLLTAA